MKKVLICICTMVIMLFAMCSCGDDADSSIDGGGGSIGNYDYDDGDDDSIGNYDYDDDGHISDDEFGDAADDFVDKYYDEDAY